MKRIILCILGLALCQSFGYADVTQITKDYEDAGFKVPEVNIMYVNSFYGRPNVQASYSNGTIIVKKDTDATRAIRHEMAHAVSLDIIAGNKAEFEIYRWNRIGMYRPQNTWYNLTADDLNIKLQWYRWYWYTLDVREIVAEDLYYMVYRMDTMHKNTIGIPSSEEQTELKRLLE